MHVNQGKNVALDEEAIRTSVYAPPTPPPTPYSRTIESLFKDTSALCTGCFGPKAPTNNTISSSTIRHLCNADTYSCSSVDLISSLKRFASSYEKRRNNFIKADKKEDL